MPPETIQTRLDGKGVRLGIVVARWYAEVTDRLLAAAVQTAEAAGTASEDILVIEVPGAYELPQAAAWLAQSEGIDAIAALGCVVRGETPHFDFVSKACCDGLMQVALDTGIPVGLGVLTVENEAQAKARSGDATGKGGNKGIEAVDAALRMAATSRAICSRQGARSVDTGSGETVS